MTWLWFRCEVEGGVFDLPSGGVSVAVEDALSLVSWEHDELKATLRGGQTIEDMVERGVIAVGSPDTVRKILTDRHHQAGFDHLLLMPQFGTLPADLTEKNIRLLTTEVIPALKALGDDDYRGFEPAAVAAE